MLSTTLPSALVCVLLLVNPAHSLPSGHDQHPRVISLPLVSTKSSAASLVKRHQSIGLSYPEEPKLHYISRRTDIAVPITIGKDNPQTVTLALDTGSEFTWVNPDCAAAASWLVQLCDVYGHFNVDQSASKRQSEFDLPDPIEYAYGAQVTPEFFTDFVSLGNGLHIPEQVFGVAKSSTELHAGILGLATAQKYIDYSIVHSMKRNNLISRAAYSIALKSQDDKGSVIFGGVDAGKFRGKLEKRSMSNTGDDIGFYIEVDHIALSTDKGPVTIAYNPVKVSIDSGATTNYMPLAQMEQAFGPLAKGRVNEQGLYVVNCEVGKRDGSVDFTFGRTVISISLQSLVDHPFNLPGSKECVFRIQPSEGTDDAWLFGLPFLDSAYTVFDLEARALHVAPAAVCDSRLVEMKNDDLSGVEGCSE